MLVYISDRHGGKCPGQELDSYLNEHINSLSLPKFLDKSVALDNQSSKDKCGVTLMFEESIDIPLLELTSSLLVTGLNSPLYDELR